MPERIPLPALMLLTFLCLFYAWISNYFWYHNDIGWHLATGDLIRQTHAIPATDPWAYTSNGAPWINLSWLWDVLASLVFQTMGGLGLLLATLAIGVATVCLLALLALRMGARPSVTLCLAVLVGVVFPFYEPPDIFLCVAPQQVTLLFTALLGLWLWRFQQRQDRALYAAITLMFALWYNMHGGFLAGDCLLGAMLAAAMLRKNTHLARHMLLLLLLASGVALANPYGLHIIDGVRGTLGHRYEREVSEWKPFFDNFKFAFALPALLYTGLFLAGLSQGRAWWGKTPFHGALILLSLVLLVKGILVLRYFSLFLLVSLPITALGISHMLRRESGAEPQVPGFIAAVAVILVMAASIAIVVKTNPSPNEMAEIRDPKPEIEFILQHYPDARLLNHWNYGSFIIYETRGRLKPIIDGRLGTAYPDPIFIDLLHLYETKDWSDILRKYDIHVILWPHIDHEMLAWFDNHPEWKVAFKGRLAEVIVKQ